MTKIEELEKFLYVEYPRRLSHIQRCVYLGITPDETRYSLELEAYEKEQELRSLIGLEPLEEIKTTTLL